MTLNDIYDLKYECFMSQDVADHWEVSGKEAVNQVTSLLSIKRNILEASQGMMFGMMIHYMGNDKEQVTLIGRSGKRYD